MPLKKQQFRFRFPRIISGSRPKQRSKSPSNERPPFRPPGIAPAPPHSVAQGTPTSSVMIESPVSSPSESPSPPSISTPLKIFKPHQSEANENVVVVQHTTAASASGVQTNDTSRRAFHADKEQKEARESETVEIKMMFATSADPVTRNVSSSSMSLENPPPQNVATVNPTQPMNDKTVSVVTLAGDNRGATMHVGSESAKKEGSIYIHRAYRTNPREEGTTDGEENSCGNSMEKEDEEEKAFVNSNIQSMNNSIMLHGSIIGRDPGVRVILPQQPIKPVDTPKAEVNIWRADKSSYQPVVRRRCLRGLFLEPSDSDPDNPHKPRRHGCKFPCGEIRKD